MKRSSFSPKWLFVFYSGAGWCEYSHGMPLGEAIIYVGFLFIMGCLGLGLIYLLAHALGQLEDEESRD